VLTLLLGLVSVVSASVEIEFKQGFFQANL